MRAVILPGCLIFQALLIILSMIKYRLMNARLNSGILYQLMSANQRCVTSL
jgi:hypothetical protein